MAVPPLELAASVNPISGTGSDLHRVEAPISFGEISVGGSQPSSVERLARDAIIGLGVALAARYLFERFFK